MRSPISLLALLCALFSIAFAVDTVHLSGASQLATHGVASQIPTQNRLIRAEERTRQAALTQKLGSSAFKASIVEAASVNAKAVAHSIGLLLDLASSNDVLDFIGNGTTSVFSRSEPNQEGNAASGRKHVAYTSIALVLVMLFFAVWM
ncbi:hypothetical protein FALBO_8086 [Fusarium albosuccineum]|uniref:Uncharacterized protein n=1 Tax=Fusarium albosuccineum TaxID=1237068 RepID=A0A8H4LCK8_9HYPO|nr:hypothetical protein FALBO_8086 [Fusarium albosuccineum]